MVSPLMYAMQKSKACTQFVFGMLGLLCLVTLLCATVAYARPNISAQGQDLLRRMERSMRDAANSPLQGAWIGSRGRDSLVLVFMNNVCAMGMNAEELYGLWSVHGNTLSLRLERDKVLDFTYALRGDTLILDRDIRLERYPLRSQKEVIPGFGDSSPHHPRNNDFGPSSSDFSGFGGGAPIDGAWVSRTSQGEAQFVFSGSEYTFYLKGREVEGGRFSYKKNQLHYTITRGAGAGKSGQHKAVLKGDTLQITSSNGQTLTFVRR